MKITLPLPTSVNSLYGRNGRRTFITEKGQAWFQEAGLELIRQRHMKTTVKDVALYVKMYAVRMDIDNICKALLDLLQKQYVIENDSQVTFLQIEKFKVKKIKEQRVEIEITY